MYKKLINLFIILLILSISSCGQDEYLNLFADTYLNTMSIKSGTVTIENSFTVDEHLTNYKSGQTLQNISFSREEETVSFDAVWETGEISSNIKGISDYGKRHSHDVFYILPDGTSEIYAPSVEIDDYFYDIYGDISTFDSMIRDLKVKKAEDIGNIEGKTVGENKTYTIEFSERFLRELDAFEKKRLEDSGKVYLEGEGILTIKSRTLTLVINSKSELIEAIDNSIYTITLDGANHPYERTSISKINY